MTPKSEAFAFRIWAYANPLEWNVSARELADEFKCSVQRINSICVQKGWTNRLRASGSSRDLGRFQDQTSNRDHPSQVNLKELLK